MTSPKRIITSYRLGTPVDQICKKYGISRTLLYRLVHEAGVPLRNKPYCPRPLTPEALKRLRRNKEIIHDRIDGMTRQKVAIKYGLTTARIGQIMKGI